METKVKIHTPSGGRGEGYSACYAAGVVTVKADSEEAANFARHQLDAAIASGHVAESLGEIKPRFPVRPLWIKSGECDIEKFGYNALVGQDYHVHEATFHDETGGLQEELALEELRSVQKEGLIFLIKEADPEWLPAFFDEVEGETIIALDADHPIWQQLRESPDASSTRLMPVLHLGLGGGLWPVYEFDRIERTLSRCFGHAFAGLLVMAECLDVNVWVAGQAQWCERPASLLGETWFRAFRPDLDYARFSEELRQVALIARMIRNFPEGDPRLVAQSLVAQLRYLEMRFAASDFSNLFKFFSRDACRYIMHYLQKNNAPMLALFNDDDMEESFWTSVKDTRVTFHETPNTGAPGSLMHQIFGLIRGSELV